MKTPLLPSLHDDASVVEAGGGRGGASVAGAVFNLSTTIIGAGIMSIPATLKVLGVAPALLLIAAVAFLSDASVGYMTRYTVHGGGGGPAEASYAGLMGESFGRVGSTALQLCVVLTNAGALIMYLIIIGDVISGNGSDGGSASHAGILAEWFGEHWWNARAVALLATLLLILFPLVLLKRVAKSIRSCRCKLLWVLERSYYCGGPHNRPRRYPITCRQVDGWVKRARVRSKRRRGDESEAKMNMDSLA